jgi:hypothetical protein
VRICLSSHGTIGAMDCPILGIRVKAGIDYCDRVTHFRGRFMCNALILCLLAAECFARMHCSELENTMAFHKLEREG